MQLHFRSWALFAGAVCSRTAFTADAPSVPDRAEAGGTWQVVSGWFQAPLFEIGDVAVTSIGLIRVAVIITVAWWISKLAQNC